MDRLSGIASLLNPRTIAIVGATPRPDSLGGRPALNLATQGYKGRIFPVNPRYQAIGDQPCYPDLAALPGPVDVVLVLVGADRVFEALDQAVVNGAKAAIVFSGGFAETGPEGAARQARLRDYARQGLRIAGPNVNGLFNVQAGIAMGFSPSFEAAARKGHVALISQSGAIATGVSSRGMEMGIGFSHVIATGNEADLELTDYLEYLVDDPAVTAFACFVEGFKDPVRFLKTARAALEAGKPIVAIKAGRSVSGQAVSLSHTGAMTGSYEVLAGAMRQAGVVVAETLDDLLSATAVFGTGKRPGKGKESGGTAVMSLSGGMASLIADRCSEAGLPLPPFADRTRTALRAAMPAYAAVANPLDVTGAVVADAALWTACATAIAADPAIDSILSIMSIVAGHSDRRVCTDLIDAGQDVLQVAVWASAAPAGCGIDLLRAAGIPTFMEASVAVTALAAWRRYWQTRDARRAVAVAPPTAVAGTDPWALLEGAGVPIARHAVVSSHLELHAVLGHLRFPLALKIQSDDILHKTELGLLRLGITTVEAAMACFDALMADARRHRPDAVIDGVLMQEMFAGRRELILGLRHEPGLGAAIVLGIGGIFSEVMHDIAVRAAPVSAFDAAEMIGELRGRGLFGAVRGLGAARPGMIEDLVQRFSVLATQLAGRFAEFEINPLILSDDGQHCAAVDVLALGR